MCQKSLKAHILGIQKALKFKQYRIITNVILLNAFCGILKQSYCSLGSKKVQRDNVLLATICLEGIIN
jgi:hypothetical protein